jgi:hypothetical protein
MEYTKGMLNGESSRLVLESLVFSTKVLSGFPLYFMLEVCTETRRTNFKFGSYRSLHDTQIERFRFSLEQLIIIRITGT